MRNYKASENLENLSASLAFLCTSKDSSQVVSCDTWHCFDVAEK